MKIKINPTYQKQIEQVKIDGEKYVTKGMRDVYAEQKKALDSTHSFIGDLYIKHAVDGKLKMTSQQKANSGVKEHLQTIGKSLGDVEVKKVSSILGQTYSDTYYKSAFIQDSGIKKDLTFDLVGKKVIDDAVNTKFKGKLFSDRIWANKANLIDDLNSSFNDAMDGKSTIDKIAKDVSHAFNTTAYDSSLLAQNENARVKSQASDDMASSSGATQQMYSATLDDKTSDECAALDGQVWDIDDPDKVVPPDNHPLCRCCLITMPFPGWTAVERKDNETKDIIDYKDYSQWKSDKGIDE